MFLYGEQDVNLAQQSYSGLKNGKIKKKKSKHPEKNCFAVRMKWVSKIYKYRTNHWENGRANFDVRTTGRLLG